MDRVQLGLRVLEAERFAGAVLDGARGSFVGFPVEHHRLVRRVLHDRDLREDRRSGVGSAFSGEAHFLAEGRPVAEGVLRGDGKVVDLRRGEPGQGSRMAGGQRVVIVDAVRNAVVERDAARGRFVRHPDDGCACVADACDHGAFGDDRCSCVRGCQGPERGARGGNRAVARRVGCRHLEVVVGLAR